MKKTLAIMISIILSFSLAVSVFAAEYDSQYFSIDIGLDGEWTEHDEYTIEFNSDSSQIIIQIMDADSLEKKTDSAFMEFYDGFKAVCDEYPDIYSFSEGMLGGLPAFVTDEVDENGEFIGKEAVILTDDFLYLISFSTEADSGDYSQFESALIDITLKSAYTGDISFEDSFTSMQTESANENNEQAENDENIEKKDNSTLVIVVVSVISAVAFVTVSVFVFKKKK